MKPNIYSEIGPLNKVFVFSPGDEHNDVLPKNIMKVRNILIPYNNKSSMDVIIRENIEKINIFFIKEKLSGHDKNKYSVRKDLNYINQTLFTKIKIKLRKIFLS